MPITVSPKWSTARLSYKRPWTAHLDWLVQGAKNQTQALAAPGVGVEKSTHPENAGLVSGGTYIVDRPGPTTFVVGADYTMVEDSGNSPVDTRTRARWRDIEVCEQVDIDLDGNPILYTNGEPISPPSRPCKYKQLTIVKWFPYWNYNWNVAFENSVNARKVKLTGGPEVEVQHMRCCSIIPVEDIIIGAAAQVLPIEFTFELVLDDSLGQFPFQHRFFNQGSGGYASDVKALRHFVDTQDNNQVLSRPLRLARDGSLLNIPSNKDVCVLDKSGKPVAPIPNPKRVATYEPNGIKQPQDAVIIYYKKQRVVDIQPLLQGLNG